MRRVTAGAIAGLIAAGDAGGATLDCRFGGDGAADGYDIALTGPDELGRRAAVIDGAVVRFAEARRDDDTTVWRALPEPPRFVLALDAAGGASLLRYRDRALIGTSRGTCTGTDSP